VVGAWSESLHPLNVRLRVENRAGSDVHHHQNRTRRRRQRRGWVGLVLLEQRMGGECRHMLDRRAIHHRKQLCNTQTQPHQTSAPQKEGAFAAKSNRAHTAPGVGGDTTSSGLICFITCFIGPLPFGGRAGSAAAPFALALDGCFWGA
jgi:hypothetical protein